MKRLAIISVLALFIVSCGSDREVRRGEVYEIRQIGTLSTTEYTLGKVIKLDDEGEWYMLGDRKILISCKAKVKAGVDLGQIKDDDIKISGTTIEITIPSAQITSFEMDPKSIKTEMTEVSGFRFQFTQEETNNILKQGEASIRKDMQQLNILNDANKNAQVFIRDFYKQLGFEEVIIHEREQDKKD